MEENTKETKALPEDTSKEAAIALALGVSKQFFEEITSEHPLLKTVYHQIDVKALGSVPKASRLEFFLHQCNEKIIAKKENAPENPALSLERKVALSLGISEQAFAQLVAEKSIPKKVYALVDLACVASFDTSFRSEYFLVLCDNLMQGMASDRYFLEHYKALSALPAKKQKIASVLEISEKDLEKYMALNTIPEEICHFVDMDILQRKTLDKDFRYAYFIATGEAMLQKQSPASLCVYQKNDALEVPFFETYDVGKEEAKEELSLSSHEMADHMEHLSLDASSSHEVSALDQAFYLSSYESDMEDDVQDLSESVLAKMNNKKEEE